MTRGLPDHFRHTLISRREVSPEFKQAPWYWLSIHSNVPYGSWYSDDIYTVQAGERLVIQFVNFSCNTLEVRQYAGLAHLVNGEKSIFLGSEFLTEKFIQALRPLFSGDKLYIFLSQRDPYIKRNFEVMIHGYTELK